MDEGFARALAWHLRPFRRKTPETQAFAVDMYVAERDEGSSPPFYSLFVRNELHYRGPDLDEVLAHTVWDLHQLVPKSARDFLYLHAGAVARDGGALVLPASMDSGKSSLVTALLRSGWGYLSDELGSIDPVTGRIYPFPKLISLDEASLGFFPALAESLPDRGATPLTERFLAPEDVGATTAAPATPRWIVFPTSEWEGEPRLTEMTSAAAVERMAKNSFNLYRYGERGVILLSRTAAGARAFELSGGTPSERAELLTRELT
ncbi:MAG: hypothetical protein M3217_07770 [Actinomycetota bacterium]|nr:hypothetical protein [Actinomycetota bacterium]